MYLDKCIECYFGRCNACIAELEKKIAALPPGKLHISKNGKYFTWHVLMPDGRRVYLPKSEEATAKKLALKNIFLAQLHDLKNEAEACARYLRRSKSSVRSLEKLFSDAGPELVRLTADSFRTKNARIAAWETAGYEKYGGYPEQIIIPTLKEGEKVRSKLEANAAGFLYTLGIPYRYEKVTVIGNTKIAVDFTALDVRNFREIPIELFGMMDNPEYRKTHNRKLMTYLNAGYIPGVNFITFYETPADPLNPMQMCQTFEDFFFNNPPRQV